MHVRIFLITQKPTHGYVEIPHGETAVGAEELWYAIGKKRTVHAGKNLERKSTVVNFEDATHESIRKGDV